MQMWTEYERERYAKKGKGTIFLVGYLIIYVLYLFFGKDRSGGYPFLFGGFGLIGILLYVVAVMESKRNIKTLNNGQEVIADVKSVMVSNGVVCLVKYTYEVNGIQYKGSTSFHKDRFNSLVIDEKLKVIYNLDEPKNSCTIIDVIPERFEEEKGKIAWWILPLFSVPVFGLGIFEYQRLAAFEISDKKYVTLYFLEGIPYRMFGKEMVAFIFVVIGVSLIYYGIKIYIDGKKDGIGV